MTIFDVMREKAKVKQDLEDIRPSGERDNEVTIRIKDGKIPENMKKSKEEGDEELRKLREKQKRRNK